MFTTSFVGWSSSVQTFSLLTLQTLLQYLTFNLGPKVEVCINLLGNRIHKGI